MQEIYFTLPELKLPVQSLPSAFPRLPDLHGCCQPHIPSTDPDSWLDGHRCPPASISASISISRYPAVLVRSNGALWSSHVLIPGSPESCRCLLYTVTVHRLLSTLLHPVQTMSFQACLAQMYFFAALGITESYLLAVISFDCAVAKGDPFTTVFSWCPGTALCWWLSLGLCPPALAFAHTAHLRTLLAPLCPSAPLLL